MITKLTSELLEKIIEELRKPENMNKLHVGIIDPLIHYTFDRLYPYIIVTSIIFLLTFFLAITILLLILKNNICGKVV
jgi:hypothetical protein